jgi:pimeloyl-ACP methyl ester carboxylesterase
MRLRLYHHHDGARVAYRETGTGRAIILLHSLGLSHREWEPVVDSLSRRFRVVVPDLPLHGDSEDRPRHPYTLRWLTEVMAGFCGEVGGRTASLVGHGFGAELALQMIIDGDYAPARLVLMGNRLHRPEPFRTRRMLWRLVTTVGAVPGADLALSHATRLVFRPRFGEKLSVQRNPQARDVVRHAFADVPGNTNRARAWAKFCRRYRFEAQTQLLDVYPSLGLPVLLLWADQDPAAPLAWAQEAFHLIPGAQLRTISDAGFLVAYDDPVVLARELISFCG